MDVRGRSDNGFNSWLGVTRFFTMDEISEGSTSGRGEHTRSCTPIQEIRMNPFLSNVVQLRASQRAASPSTTTFDPFETRRNRNKYFLDTHLFGISICCECE